MIPRTMNNLGFSQYFARSTTSSSGFMLLQGKRSFIPTTNGSQQRNMNNRVGVEVAASQNLRPKTPQLPPVVYCSMSNASDPRLRPRQNIKPTSQDCRKSFLSTTTQMMEPTVATAATKVATVRSRLTVAGGAKSAGVTRTVVLTASHLPQAVAAPPDRAWR